MGDMENITENMTVTIERVGKPAFEKAFRNGQRVAIVKDPQWWRFTDDGIGSRHNVPGPVGFTNATISLEDVYSDGPSRPGEAFRYWIVTPAEEAKGAVLFDATRGQAVLNGRVVANSPEEGANP